MISDSEVRATLESVAATTQNAAVRRVMKRAVEILDILDSQGFEVAGVEVLREMAKTKRTERQLVWVNLAVAAGCLLILFAVLVGFWRGI